MTSAKVTELMQAAFGTVSQTKPGLPEGTPNFSMFMEKETGSLPTAENLKEQPVQTDAKDAYEKADKKVSDTVSKETKVSQETVAEKPDDRQVDETAKELTSDVIESVSQKLGVSEEEIVAAMEVLGLFAADLMVQGNMARLIARVTAATQVDILTDDSLFSQMDMLVSEVTDEISQAAESLGMTPEEFADVMMRQSSGQMEASEDAALPEETEMSDFMTQQAVTNEKQVEGQGKTVVSIDEKVVPEQTEPDASKVQDALQKNSAMPGEQEQTGQESDFFEKQKMPKNEQVSHTDGAAQETVVGGATFEQNIQELQRPQDLQTPELPRTQEIIDQIAEQVKIHRSEQITQMEITLNPASLGNIHLQVSSKAGMVSAQLIAQDQAVAAALEGQLLQLKESLQAQGMRVDAVEVTVSSHAFEQNLDQQGRQQEEEAKKAGKRGQRRILDLNAVDGDGQEDGELSQAEKLQVEMMRMGGNRMNYRV